MMRIVLIFGGAGLLSLLVSCAPLTPDLPSGDEQQLNRPGTLSGPPPKNPFDIPDEATLPPVPGQ